MPKNVNHALVQKEHLPARSSKLLRLVQRRVGQAVEICAHTELPDARYKACTNARYILKGSFEEGEPKNVNLALVEKPTFLCGPANYCVSCSAVKGSQ